MGIIFSCCCRKCRKNDEKEDKDKNALITHKENIDENSNVIKGINSMETIPMEINIDERQNQFINGNEIKGEKNDNKIEVNYLAKYEEKEKEFEEREKLLNKRENNLNEKEKERNQKEKEINEKKQSLIDQENELTKRVLQLNEKEKEINEKEKERIEKEKFLIDQENELTKRVQQLNEKEKEINEKEKERIEKEKSLIDKENELTMRDQQLNEKVETINDKEKSLNEKQIIQDEEITKKENELKEIENQLNERSKAIDDKEKLLIQNNNIFIEERKNKEKEIKDKEEKIKKQFLQLEKEKKKLILDKEKFEKEKEDEKLPFLIGLDNIGATCYMNSTLQALSNTNGLTKYFLNEFKYDPNDITKKMSNEYYKVLINLWDKNKKKGSYSPNDFKNVLSVENPLFAGIQANDSKDLINFLLERFHSELNKKNNQQVNINYNVNQLNEMETLGKFLQDFQNNYKSIISDCFYGVLETKNQCSGCNTIKYNFQIYSFLEFPLEQVNIYCFQNGRRNALINNDGSKPDVDLLECFDYYQKIEMMTGDNQMYCNFCQANLNAYYNTSLYSLPLYLIINLNRGKNAVYQCKVNFPEKLNLLNYVSYKDGVTALNLYAVICHYGPSSMSGHFIAYCRNQKDNKWYSYNDSIVTECTKPKPYNDIFYFINLHEVFI